MFAVLVQNKQKQQQSIVSGKKTTLKKKCKIYLFEWRNVLLLRILLYIAL